MVEACTSQVKQNDDITTIHINCDAEPVAIQQSGLINDLRIIKLQTSSESLIGKIDKTEIFEDKIYIADFERQCMLVFDTTGKFICQINRRGRAENEYNTLMDFYIDTKNGTLNLLSRNPSKILRFSADGKQFSESVALPAEFTSAATSDNGTVLLAGNYIQSAINGCNLVETAAEGEIRHCFLPIDEAWQGRLSLSEKLLSTYNGNVYFTSPRDFTILKLEDGKLTPYHNIDFGKYCWPSDIKSWEDFDAYRKKHPEPEFVRYVSRFQETENFCLSDFTLHGRQLFGIYDKKNKTAELYIPDANEKKYFTPFGRIVGLSEKHMITSVPATRMAVILAGGDKYNDFESQYPQQIERMRDILGQVTEQDNDFLIVYTLN